MLGCSTYKQGVDLGLYLHLTQPWVLVNELTFSKVTLCLSLTCCHRIVTLAGGIRPPCTGDQSGSDWLKVTEPARGRDEI